MYKLTIIIALFLNVNCSDIKKEPKYFDALKGIKIDLIVVKRNEIEEERITSKNKIDSIVSRMQKTKSQFIKFSSKSKLFFYNRGTLKISVFYSDKYFKYNGTTYSW